MAVLFKYLAARYPDTLTRIITRTLDEVGQPHAYASLPHECWDVISDLPNPSKLQLRRHFQHQPAIWSLQDDDPNVKAVATAGIELFTTQRNRAARNEKLQRIRGYS